MSHDLDKIGRDQEDLIRKINAAMDSIWLAQTAAPANYIQFTLPKEKATALEQLVYIENAKKAFFAEYPEPMLLGVEPALNMSTMSTTNGNPPWDNKRGPSTTCARSDHLPPGAPFPNPGISLNPEVLTLKENLEEAGERNAKLYKANIRLREKLEDKTALTEELRVYNKRLEATIARLLNRGPSLGFRMASEKASGQAKAQAELDRLVWGVLDNLTALVPAGGWYRLDDIALDICADFPEYEPSDLEISIEDAIETAQRWCSNRTSWWGDRRFWLQRFSTGGYSFLIVKRSRFSEHLPKAPPHALPSLTKKRRAKISERGSRVII